MAEEHTRSEPREPDDEPKAELPRSLRDRPLGKAAILAAVLIAAVLVARTCGSRDVAVTKEEAVEIAKQEISFTPDLIQVKFIPLGVSSRPAWAVSFSRQPEPEGALEDVTVVVVDAESGEIVEIRRE